MKHHFWVIREHGKAWHCFSCPYCEKIKNEPYVHSLCIEIDIDFNSFKSSKEATEQTINLLNNNCIFIKEIKDVTLYSTPFTPLK